MVSMATVIETLLLLLNFKDQRRLAEVKKPISDGDATSAEEMDVIVQQGIRLTVAEVLQRAANRPERAKVSATEVTAAARAETESPWRDI